MYSILFYLLLELKATKVSLDSPILKLRRLGIGQNIGEVSPSSEYPGEYVLTVKDPKLGKSTEDRIFQITPDIFGTMLSNITGCITSADTGLRVESCYNNQEFGVLRQRFILKKAEHEKEVSAISSNEEAVDDRHKYEDGTVEMTKKKVVFPLNHKDNKDSYDYLNESGKKRKNIKGNNKKKSKKSENEDKSSLHLNGNHPEIEKPVEDFLFD